MSLACHDDVMSLTGSNTFLVKTNTIITFLSVLDQLRYVDKLGVAELEEANMGIPPATIWHHLYLTLENNLNEIPNITIIQDQTVKKRIAFSLSLIRCRGLRRGRTRGKTIRSQPTWHRMLYRQRYYSTPILLMRTRRARGGATGNAHLIS